MSTRHGERRHHGRIAALAAVLLCAGLLTGSISTELTSRSQAMPRECETWQDTSCTIRPWTPMDMTGLTAYRDKAGRYWYLDDDALDTLMGWDGDGPAEPTPPRPKPTDGLTA